MPISPVKKRVLFFFEDVRLSLTGRSALKKFILDIFRAEKKELDSLNYIFCSDKELLKINREFLHHDFYTDIITFDLSEQKSAIQGEIYVSVDRIRENAKNLKVSFKSELHRVVFHGALHLCGYKDKTKKEISLMRQKERFYLEKYFL